MKSFYYYMFSALAGGLVGELNKPHSKNEVMFKLFFIRGFTSVIIGIIFGMGSEALVGNVDLSIALSALMGVGGYASIDWMTKVMKKTIEKKIKV